jgi:PTH1 family peptidyl-tRNA hydrolase
VFSWIWKKRDKEAPVDWAIFGLGNPGDDYARTRHNMGFMTLDALGREEGVPFSQKKFDSRVGRGILSGCGVLLVKPETYMNRSGIAVARFVHFYRLDMERVIVVHDDIDLPPGDVRVKSGGGTAGHKGLDSIIRETGHADFVRVRIGIGRPEGRTAVERYVLERFSEEEMPVAASAAERAAGAVREVVSSGPERAMNRVNARPQKI